MSKITDRSDLNVGVELIINEPNRTFELVEAGNLVAKDGVSIQALYSKFVDLWATETYQDSPFPMNAIDALSGQYLIGVDAGNNANGWKPLNTTTRQIMRDGGWQEFDASGDILRIYAGIVGLGTVSSGAQLYYQSTPNESPNNFTFEDQANEGIQVFGNADNGNFDNRAFFKGYVREQGRLYRDSILADTGKTTTGAFIVNILLSDSNDLKIVDDDSEMTNSPYSGITVEYFGSDQQRDVGGSNYNYDIIIDGNGASLEEIYTKAQFLLRQDSDIDSGSGTVNGKTADLLCGFVGDILETNNGVYIDNISALDTNRIVFKDTAGINRANAFVSTGTLNFNAIMVGGGSSYRLMFTNGPSSDDDYGEAGAITVVDASGDPVTGVISNGSISFTFDYDGDTVGGTAGTDKNVTLIGIRPNSSKFAVATSSLSRSKTIAISLVAETDRAYL
jgi:hypothetical protein